MKGKNVCYLEELQFGTLPGQTKLLRVHVWEEVVDVLRTQLCNDLKRPITQYILTVCLCAL